MSIASQKRSKPAAKNFAAPHSAAFADRRRDPGSKRDAVLQTAVEMFIAKGYRQTSLDDIARTLKITKPALYHYFRNKEEIYLECYRRGIALTEESLERIRSHAGSGLEKVAGFIQTYTVIIARDFGRFLIRQDDRELSPKSQAEVRAQKRKIDHSLRSFIEQGIADGSVRQCNIRLAAFSVAGAIHSLSTWFEPGGELTAEQVAAEFAQTLTQGLANRRSAKLRVPDFDPLPISTKFSSAQIQP